MPYTDLRPHHGRLRLTAGGLVVRGAPWLTVVDRCFAAPRRPQVAIRLGLWIRSRRHPAIPRPAGDGLRPLTICCGSRRIGWPRRGRPRRGRPAPGRSASPSVPGIYGGRSAADRRRVAVGQAGDGGGRRAVAGQQDHDQAQADAAGPCSTPSKSQEQPAGQVALGVHGWEASFRQPRRVGCAMEGCGDPQGYFFAVCDSHHGYAQIL